MHGFERLDPTCEIRRFSRPAKAELEFRFRRMKGEQLAHLRTVVGRARSHTVSNRIHLRSGSHR